jgi:multidrug efflux system outer membrane protein
VLEAEALLAAARGESWPELGYGLSAARTKNSFVLPTVGRTGIWSTTFSQGLNLGYQVDLFGRLARSRQAAWAEALAADADRDTVVHTLVASVVRSRVRVSTLQRQLKLARANTASWQRSVELVERRYGHGLMGPLELRLARENLAASLAEEAVAEQALRQASHLLDLQLGRRPGTGAPLPDDLADLPELEPVPLGLPVALLDRRPDLRAAEMRLAASTARIGVALANLFPSLTLTGSLGTTSDDLTGLVSSDGLVYGIVADLLAPIFSGGKRRAQVTAARARAEQAAAGYASAILNALREVEDALVAERLTRVAERLTRQRLAHLNVRLREATAAERLARQRYRRGVDSLLLLLETERRRRQSEILREATRAELWNARVDLFLSLGGDWEQQADQSEQKDDQQAQEETQTPHATTSELIEPPA